MQCLDSISLMYLLSMVALVLWDGTAKYEGIWILALTKFDFAKHNTTNLSFLNVTNNQSTPSTRALESQIVLQCENTTVLPTGTVLTTPHT